MQITTGLLTKGLMGLGAVVGVVTGSVFLFKKGEEPAKVSAVSTPTPLPPPPKPPTLKEKVKKVIDETVIENSWFDGNAIKGLNEKNGTSLPFKTSGILENLKTIKFTTDGSDEWNLDDSINGQKMEIRDSSDEDNFPGGIMLVIENMGLEVKIKKKDDTSDTTKTFKTKTNPEFKLEGDKFKYAWTIKTLGEKVGLDCKEENGSKTCTFKSGAKINVWETVDNTDKKVEDVTFEGTLKYEEEQEGYNQGFKLTPTSDITLKKEGESSLHISSLSSSTSYDIKFIVASNVTNKWYLRKYHTRNQ